MYSEKRETAERTDIEGSRFREEVFSKVVRAGKRTYFFDVKSTRSHELYLTITESKKKADRNGNFFYEKHKIFLYKEDFEKFADGLSEVVRFIDDNQPIYVSNDNPESVIAEYSAVEFDDLSK